jgi:signal transduction histidine kinase
VISHNLRDPVSQILGFTDLFNKPGNEDIQNDMIDWIRKSALNLDTIIKDLTIVLNQQDSTSNVEEKACVNESVQSVMTSLENEIKKVKPIFQHLYNDDLCLPIQKSYLYNIIYNLTSNSLKYRNPDKQLEIIIKAEHIDHSMQLKFTDNGLGFDSSRFGDKIFKMYQRFHLEKEGRGLGLYLVKSQIESVGGSIDVCSTPGVGTTFTIDLPIKTDEVAIIS